MSRAGWGIAFLGLLTAVLCLLAVAPVGLLAPQRLAVARWLVARDLPAPAIRIYRALANAGVASAKNNLAVLEYRGLANGDRREARTLLHEAARGGSVQAANNLAAAEGVSSCTHHAETDLAVVRGLAPRVVLGDRAAGRALFSCLYLVAVRERVPDGDRLLVSAARSIAPADGLGRLTAGRALLNAARSTPRPFSQRRFTQAEQKDYEARMAVLLEQAAADLLAAGRLGQPEAFDWLATMRREFVPILKRTKGGAAILAKTAGEWLDAGAGTGNWREACAAASEAIGALQARPHYGRAELDAVVADAMSSCVDREEAAAPKPWDQAEYPLVAPRPSLLGPPYAAMDAVRFGLRRLVLDNAAKQARAGEGTE